MNFEMRRAARLAMRGVPERLGLEFARGNIEMRAKPNGTAAGSVFTWEGYATVFDAPFPMWDQDGQPFTEVVAPGAATRTLNNPNLDVPFLIGHNSAGIPLARTKSGTMQLSQDSHGVLSYVPSMDGRREEVRALASAVERGDIDEMSLAFVCTRQAWDAAYEQRTILEMDLHRGDVCAVTHGANPATAGSRMYPAEMLAYRRPAAIGGPRLLEARMPTQPYERGPHETVTCPQCQCGNDLDAMFCDQCGTGLRPQVAYMADSTDTQLCRECGCWQAPDARCCDQCGRSMMNDHDADDGYGPAYALYGAARQLELRAAAHAPMTGTHTHPHPAYGSQGGDASHEHEHSHDGDADHGHHAEAHASGRPLELRSLTASEKSQFTSDIGNSSKNSTQDLGSAIHRLVQWAGSGHYPQGTSYADLQWMYDQICAELKKRDPKSTAGGNFPAEHHAAGNPATEVRCQALTSVLSSVRERTAPEKHASGRPLESRASAAEDAGVASASDYDAEASGHTQPCKTCGGKGRLPHPQTGLNGVKCPGCNGSGAVVTVDDSTGIPGPEQQLADQAARERREREMELELAASH